MRSRVKLRMIISEQEVEGIYMYIVNRSMKMDMQNGDVHI